MDDAVRPSGEADLPPDDPLPVDTMPADHPLYGFDVDGLLQSDGVWMR